MKFTYDGADLSETIKSFKHDGWQYTIEYFDGTSTNFVCSNEEQIKNIKQKMYEQAVERQDIMADYNYPLKVTLGLYLHIINTTAFTISISCKADFLTWLFSLGGLLNLFLLTKNVRIKRELEKYLLFFKMYNHLDEVNKAKFMECIEFDHMYQKRLDIDTVDEFSLGEVKTLYRHLEENNKK